MKSLFIVLITFCMPMMVVAQRSEFISCERYKSADSFLEEYLKEKEIGGVMLLSATKDLVISLSEEDKSLRDKIKGDWDDHNKIDGMWIYRILIPFEHPRINIIVSRRGEEAFNTKETVKINQNMWTAYKVTYVTRPIGHFDQSDQTNTITGTDSLAKVEFVTDLENLTVDCRALSALSGTTLNEKKSHNGNSTITYELTYSVKPLIEAENRYKASKDKYEQYRGDENIKSKLRNDCEDAERRLSELSEVNVYAEGTNVRTIQLGMEKKMIKTYSVVLLKKEVHVSECTGFLQEAEKLYKLRDYENARKGFMMALNARDTPDDAHITIETRMAECDTCAYYDKLALLFLRQRKQLLDRKQTDQEEWVNVNNNAIEVIGKLNKYNECDFYSSRLQKLKKDIGVPLSMSFTATKWERHNQSMQEGGPIANVEVWAYYGINAPTMKEYDSDGKFKKLVSSDLYRLLGSTDVHGQTLLELNRDELPMGLLFHPVGWGKSLQNVYMDMRQIMRQSKGSYTQRQFRLRMYYDK
ncbi:MAG: hypothetical protein IJ199_06440 [Prevotella sp.]|nr:hypothetical protein [Prevotella sp.]